MNTRTKLIALLLAGVMILSLAACSGTADTEPDATPEVSDSTAVPETSDSTSAPEVSNNASNSVLPDDFEADPNVEDLCLAAAGIPGTFELFTVNGQPVSAQMYLYWLASGISETESNYGFLPWDEKGEFAEYMKADALNATLVYTLIPKNTLDMGFALTQAQIDEFDAITASTIEYIGGEEKFDDALRTLGIDRDTYLAIERTSYYFDQLVAGLSSTHPNDDDITAYVEEKGGVLGAKHILLLTKDMTTGQSLSDDVIAQKKATAESILKQLQESSNLAADFDALMHEHSEDGGLATNPDGYTFLPGKMVAEFEEGTRALEIGQISGIVESTYGYHIILRQEPNLKDPSLLEECLSWLVTNQVNTWVSEADVVLTNEYNSLDPQLFYEKFMAYQVAFSAARNSAS